MNKRKAQQIIRKAFRNATDKQFLRQAEWLLNGWPILSGEDAKIDWELDGVP